MIPRHKYFPALKLLYRDPALAASRDEAGDDAVAEGVNNQTGDTPETRRP